jgi:predicted polyphosphate/ATP-dependent NAD kinase
MHTLKVIAVGIALLVACGAAGYGATGAAGISRAALISLPLWAIGAGVNMYLGVKRAGYSFADEAPIFLRVFAVPAAASVGAWFKYR